MPTQWERTPGRAASMDQRHALVRDTVTELVAAAPDGLDPIDLWSEMVRLMCERIPALIDGGDEFTATAAIAGECLRRLADAERAAL